MTSDARHPVPAADTLLVVDVQRACVLGPDAVPGAARVLAAVDALLDTARAAGALVVHLQNDGPSGAADEPGADGWALARPPLPGETVVRKREDDGFVATDLAAVLGAAGSRVAVVCGVQSEMCVAATARGAMLRGLSVVLPRDAHATYPVPADATGGIAVPADHVSRVAEWSLGDGVHAPSSCSDVHFTRPTR